LIRQMIAVHDSIRTPDIGPVSDEFLCALRNWSPIHNWFIQTMITGGIRIGNIFAGHGRHTIDHQ